MIEYIFLIFIPVIFSFVSIEKNRTRKTLLLGTSRSITENSMAFVVFFAIYFLMLALRNVVIGNDTLNYKNFFEAYHSSDYRIINYVGFEYLYGLFNWLFHKVSHNFQLFLFSAAAFCVYPMAKLYCENKKHSLLQIAIFINLSTFVMLFSGLRQAMAMAMGIIAYNFVREKKLFWFIATCFVALGFHHSAFILFLMYPLYHIAFKKKDLWYIIPTIGLVVIFNTQIFSLLANLMALFSNKYEDVSITQTGAITTFLMFAAFAIFCYIIPDESKMDKEMFGLRNILLFSMVLQSFASLHTLAMRMNYYYMIFIPIIVAKVIDIPKDRYKQVAKLGGLIIAVFLFGYFFMGLYRDYITGESALNTVPYKFFWETTI